MAGELTRMWINQPSSLQWLHDLHGTNVLAQHEHGDTMRIFFLSGNTVSQQVARGVLAEGWRELPQAIPVLPHQDEVIEVVSGLHNALSRMIERHNDSDEAEWLGHSNELVRKVAGHDIRFG